MKAHNTHFTLVPVLALLFAMNCISQVNSPTIKVKAPKFTFTVATTLNYVTSQKGELDAFSLTYDPQMNMNKFDSKSLAMEWGFGIITQGKFAVSKNRKVGIYGTAGFNYFYNTDAGTYRTRWNIFNLGIGGEYNFNPKQNSSPYISAEVNYTIMSGAWQTNVTFPDNSVSNIYVKFKPASRLGITLGTGSYFKLGKNLNFNLGLRGVWSNIGPKSNNYSGTDYTTYINDSENSNGIQLNNSKNVIYVQVISGLSFVFAR